MPSNGAWSSWNRSWKESVLFERWRSSPELELLVVGPPRSGTSMVSNLMTRPPRTLVLYEPRLEQRRLSRPLRHQLQELGLSPPRSNRRLLSWADRTVERWGVKEVAGRSIRWTYEKHRPRHVVLVLRDLRHAALSMYDRLREVPGGMGLEKRLGWMREAVEAVLDLHDRHPPARRLTVRYEEAVADPSILEAVGERLDWPLEGDVGVGFAGQRRGAELERHAGGITDRSVRLRAEETDPDKLVFADRVATACRRYQERFGYARGGGRGTA